MLALMFCSFWEAQCGAKHCFYISKLTFSSFEKVIMLPSFLDAKSRPRTSKYLTFCLSFSICFYITKSENIKSVWYIPRFVRVRVLRFFMFFNDFLWFSCIVFLHPSERTFAHLDRSRGPPNRHLSFKNYALA